MSAPSEDPTSASQLPNFWEQIYDADEARWDLGGPSPVLAATLDLGLLADRPRVFVPGCGRGHDALLLAERGHQVVAVDFARQAVEALRSRAQERGLEIEVRRASIFDINTEPARSFDAVFEYTCYCAIDPGLRGQYRRLVTHLVRPGGRLLFNVFPLWRDDEPEGGPPHVLDTNEVVEGFGQAWRTILRTRPAAAPPGRRGREELLVLERT